jgi:site-specific DNA-methyltransferase (adenine-specific)
MTTQRLELVTGDCLEWLRSRPDNSVDLIFGSPPYEAARTYGIDFKISGQDWVDWMVERWVEFDRVCRGLVAMVVEGQTRKFQWSAVPALLMADLHRKGIKLRKPPAFQRVGIPGSGGPDWLRNDYEFIVCSTRGKLPWSDNTAMGHPPKWAPGGEMSYRNSNGTRRNQWGHSGGGDAGARKADGERTSQERPSHEVTTNRDAYGFTPHVEPSETQRKNGKKRIQHADDGTVKGGHRRDIPEQSTYAPPVLANPGNVIACKVGGGVMGDRLCHENEAPFPEAMAEFFVKSFCPPGGTVLDPYSGSGTTAAVALLNDRSAIGIDVRPEQIELARRRIRGQVGLLTKYEEDVLILRKPCQP